MEDLEETQQWIMDLWEKIKNNIGEKNLERMDKMFKILAGEDEVSFLVPLQTPYSFYLCGLEAAKFHDTSIFPFVKILEERYGKIRDELVRVIEEKEGTDFTPYLGDGVDDDKGTMVSAGQWKVKYLYRNFLRNEENCSEFPITSEILDSLGTSILRGMICFSAIEPGTHILPHCGPSNMRLTCHLGIIGCQDVFVTVGGETRMYEDGKCIIFDDSFLHEVRHKGTQKRVTLMLDLWHPGMTEPEIDAFTQLIQKATAKFDAEHFLHSLHIYKKVIAGELIDF